MPRSDESISMWTKSTIAVAPVERRSFCGPPGHEGTLSFCRRLRRSHNKRAPIVGMPICYPSALAPARGTSGPKLHASDWNARLKRITMALTPVRSSPTSDKPSMPTCPVAHDATCAMPNRYSSTNFIITPNATSARTSGVTTAGIISNYQSIIGLPATTGGPMKCRGHNRFGSRRQGPSPLRWRPPVTIPGASNFSRTKTRP